MKNVTSLLVILISVGLYFLYIGPAWSNTSALSAELSSYQTVLQKSKQIIDTRDSMLTTYNAISSDDMARLQKALPTTFDGVAFANEIHTLASAYGLTVKQIKFDQVSDSQDRTAVIAPAGPYKTIPVSMILIGPYPGFVAFLKSSELSLNLMDVTRLAIAPPLAVAKASSNSLEYDIDMTTYSLK